MLSRNLWFVKATISRHFPSWGPSRATTVQMPLPSAPSGNICVISYGRLFNTIIRNIREIVWQIFIIFVISYGRYRDKICDISRGYICDIFGQCTRMNALYLLQHYHMADIHIMCDIPEGYVDDIFWTHLSKALPQNKYEYKSKCKHRTINTNHLSKVPSCESNQINFKYK